VVLEKLDGLDELAFSKPDSNTHRTFSELYRAYLAAGLAQPRHHLTRCAWQVRHTMKDKHMLLKQDLSIAGVLFAVSGLISAGTGCAVEAGTADVTQDRTESVASAHSELLTDPTGTIQVVIRQCAIQSFSGGLHSTSCTVPSDFVMIGGGGQVVGQPVPGALLQASEPAGSSVWYIQAKDHVVGSSYQLQAAVVGLKLAGVSQSALQSLVTITQTVATPAGHSTTAFAFPPAGHVVLGGGALATSPGGQQLLSGTAPYPTSTGSVPSAWVASAKDHVVSDIGNVKAFVISIPACPPGFGACLTSKVVRATSPSGGGYRSITMSSTSLVTGFGATADYGAGAGRLLTAIWPTDLAFGNESTLFVNSKDHQIASPGTTTGFQITLSRI
jgi:vibriolysin